MKEIDLRTVVTTFEYLCGSISCKQTEMVLLTIYRRGSKPATQKFLDELSIILETLSTYRRPIVITGDINIRVERENNAMAIRFRDMLVSFDLIIHSTTATHQCGGQLDLVITRSEMNNMQVNVLETGISDHLMLAFNVPLQKADETASSFSGRSWKGFDFDAFRDDLQTSELCVDFDKFKNESTDEIFDRYSLILKGLLDRHAPYTNKKPRRHLLTPWFDAECRAFKRSARRLERVYRRNKTLENRLAWVKTLQAMRSFFQAKEHSYWETRVATDHKAPKNYGGILTQFSAKKNQATPAVPSLRINLQSFSKTRLHWCESRRPQQHRHKFRSRAKNILTVFSRLLRKKWKL